MPLTTNEMSEMLEIVEHVETQVHLMMKQHQQLLELAREMVGAITHSMFSGDDCQFCGSYFDGDNHAADCIVLKAHALLVEADNADTSE